MNIVKDLKQATFVPFDRLLLDPNNPRIAPGDTSPGYDNPLLICEVELQARLVEEIYRVYKPENLETAIVAQGWVPIDAILVWEHPHMRGWYVVVEGNTRTAVLRRIRDRLNRLREKLARVKRSPRSYAAHEVDEIEREIERLEQIVSDTEQIQVSPVNAETVEELQAVLPRLLGVRHIQHAKQWTPYAQDLYLLSLYDALWRHERPGKPLALEKELLQRVGDIISLSEGDTRRAIQAAAAFSHFKREYTDQLPEGEGFRDEDEYFFKQILENPYPREQFDFGKDDLKLNEQMEQVLFKWAFALPRPKGKDNPNKLYKAENFRDWNSMRRYDDKHSTGFSVQFDVKNPDDAPTMEALKAEWMTYKSRTSPVDTISKLIQAFSKINVEILEYQGAHLRLQLEELIKKAETFVRIIEAMEEEEPAVAGSGN